MLSKGKETWDRLEKLEYSLWLEENPGGTLRDFNFHLASLNAGIDIDDDTEYSVEEMERMYRLHISRR